MPGLDSREMLIAEIDQQLQSTMRLNYFQPPMQQTPRWSLTFDEPEDGIQTRMRAWANYSCTPPVNLGWTWLRDDLPPGAKVSVSIWADSWVEFWGMVGAAHEATVFNKKVVLVDGKLQVS